MKCRICGHSMIAEQEVPVKENLTDMISLSPQMYSEKKMTIYYCDKCQHRQIDFLMDDTFYDVHDSVHEGAKQYYGELANRNKYIENIHKYVYKIAPPINSWQCYFLKCFYIHLLKCFS